MEMLSLGLIGKKPHQGTIFVVLKQLMIYNLAEMGLFWLLPQMTRQSIFFIIVTVSL